MIFELLLALLIIIIVFLFLIFFKSWHIHIIFKNDNWDYFYRIIINFLFFNITVFTLEKIVRAKLQINLLSKTINVFELKLNDDSEETSENDSQEAIESDSEDDEKELFEKIKESYPILYDAKDQIYSIIELLVKMLKFDESWIVMNLGLSDNNLTIKFCSLLWTLFAPLCPAGLKLYLTPEINKLLIKTDINVKFDLFLGNILKILFLVVRSKKLRRVIQLFI